MTRHECSVALLDSRALPRDEGMSYLRGSRQPGPPAATRGVPSRASPSRPALSRDVRADRSARADGWLSRGA